MNRVSKRALKRIEPMELFALCRTLSCRLGEAAEAADFRLNNRLYDQLDLLYAEIKGRGREVHVQLLDLLGDECPGTRLWAAVRCLPIDEKKAIATLESISHSHFRIIAFDAAMVIEEWRKGNLHL